MVNDAMKVSIMCNAIMSGISMQSCLTINHAGAGLPTELDPNTGC